MDEGSAVDIVYLDVTKAFDTFSHNILTGELRKCGPDEWIEVDGGLAGGMM